MTCSLLAGLLLDLLEEEPVLLGELRAEALVQHLDDLGQRRLLVLRLAGADIGRALDVLRLALLQHRWHRRTRAPAGSTGAPPRHPP